MPYLFVHFKEKLTPDGEQVYFAISKNGYNWEQVNDGNPVLSANLGECGCRDVEIIRLKTGEFVILTTDLCIANRYDENYNINWKNVNSSGSKNLRMWKTYDLINFSEEKLIYFGRDDFGCLWAPEIFYDDVNDEYFIHWGSTVEADEFSHMSIYCCTTKDFEKFTKPQRFFAKNNEILDSHIVKIGNEYHLFYKNAHNPSVNLHAVSNDLYGEFINDDAFQRYMLSEEATFNKPGSYEGPTTFVLPDGKWCLLLDFFGCEKEKMGYVPFLSEKSGDCNFKRADDLFSFPYGFKHGKVIEITCEEYERLKHYEF